MKRLALVAVLSLIACAKREEKPQEAPTPPPPVTAVTAIEKGPATKFQGMPVMKQPVHGVTKDPVPTPAAAASSAK